jgi:hypothetical protein
MIKVNILRHKNRLWEVGRISSIYSKACSEEQSEGYVLFFCYLVRLAEDHLQYTIRMLTYNVKNPMPSE